MMKSNQADLLLNSSFEIRNSKFNLIVILALVSCTAVTPSNPTQPAVAPPPAEMSSIVVPIHASLAPLLPLIEAQVPKNMAKLDAYELDPSQRFGLRYSVYRDPIVLNMQNAGLHTSAHVHYALEGCVKSGARMWPCLSCGFGEPMRDVTIELQTRFDWSEGWALRSTTTPRPVEFGSPCEVTRLGIDITEWKLRPLVDEQLRDAAKTIDHNTPKLASIRPYAQQVWSSLLTPYSIAPKTWLVIEPADVALAPIRGSGLNVTSALVLHARTRVVIGDKPAVAAKPLPALRTASSADTGIRVPFDLEIPYTEISRVLTDQFGKKTYSIEGGTLAVDTIRLSAGTNGRMNIEAAIDYRGRGIKKYRGFVYLDGLAKFDPSTSRVMIDDLEYSIDPKRRGIVRALDHVAHEAIRSRLRDSARWPVAGDIASLKTDIEHGVTRPLATGVSLRGKVDSIEPISVTPGVDGVSIRVVAVGSASVDIVALR
jgi:Domain of unknown function (DUF4403)